MQAEPTDIDTKNSDKICDSDIVNYLCGNPEFFVNNQEILTRLKVPHDSGAAVSLIEKQVSVMRGRCNHLENNLRSLISVARHNESLHQRLHTLIQEIITAPTLQNIVDLTRSTLRESFSAEEVHVLLIAPAPKRTKAIRAKSNTDQTANSSAAARTASKKPARRQPAKLACVNGAIVVRHTDKRIKEFNEVFDQGETLCGMPSTEQLLGVAGKRHANVASAAIIPLFHERKIGLIMLTSEDESRFSSDKGVMFLNQMGDLLARRIHTYGADKLVIAK